MQPDWFGIVRNFVTLLLLSRRAIMGLVVVEVQDTISLTVVTPGVGASLSVVDSLVGSTDGAQSPELCSVVLLRLACGSSTGEIRCRTAIPESNAYASNTTHLAALRVQ